MIAIHSGKLRWAIAGTAMFFLLALLVFRIYQRVQIPPVSNGKSLPVDMVQLASRPFAVYIESVGTVTADRRILVSARIAASVLEVPNREGSLVEKGTLLVRLDDEETKRELQRQSAAADRARSELSYWQKEFVADQELFDKGMLERRSMDDSRRRINTLEMLLKEAESARELAQVRSGWTYITAPFTGYVQKNVVLPGEQVTPGAAMVELVAAQPLKVIVPVAESDLYRLTENQPATVYLPALHRQIETRIHRIYPALDSRSRNATIELTLPLTTGLIRPGMAAEVKILAEFTQMALVVPHQAVRLQGTHAGVFVIESGIAQWRKVKTGASQGGEIVLVEGVKAGERVITTPHPGLVQGRAVTISDSLANKLVKANQ